MQAPYIQHSAATSPAMESCRSKTPEPDESNVFAQTIRCRLTSSISTTTRSRSPWRAKDRTPDDKVDVGLGFITIGDGPNDQVLYAAEPGPQRFAYTAADELVTSRDATLKFKTTRLCDPARIVLETRRRGQERRQISAGGLGKCKRITSQGCGLEMSCKEICADDLGEGPLVCTYLERCHKAASRTAVRSL